MKTALFFSAVAFASMAAVSAREGPPTAPPVRRVAAREAAPPTVPEAFRRQYFGSIIEISSGERVLVVRDNSLGPQTLHLDGRTKIEQGDKPASWSDLQVGAMVDGVCVGPPTNAYAETVNIGR
jgi:hypothetical protein